MLALSTAWFPREDGRPPEEIFARLTQQGFAAFELNYVVHPIVISALRRLSDELGFVITSLHNICSELREPLEPDDAYGDNIASLDEEARQQSASHLRTTAEAARALGAGAVVVHAGYVPSAKEDMDYRDMRRAFARGEVDKETISGYMRQKVAERHALGRPHVAQLIKSLREVCPDFPEIRFGLECRYHYYSLPDIDEMEEVLGALAMDNVGYWHDCGHAQVQENMGIVPHREWLNRYGERLIGVHLHGMRDAVHDHFAPAPGNMPLEMVRAFLRPDTIRVLELGKFNDLESIIAGRDYVESVFSATEAIAR